MLDSNQLAELTANFLKQGGQIDKQDIIVRDWQHPTKTGFMRPSYKDAPKQDFTPLTIQPKSPKVRKVKSNRKRDQVIALLKSGDPLTAKNIAESVECDVMYIYMIARELNVTVANNQDRQISEIKDLLRAAMYKGEPLSNFDLTKLTGASSYMINRTAREVGFKLTPNKGKIFHDAIGRIQELDTASMTRKEIMQELGCTIGHVSRLLRRFNLPFKYAVKTNDKAH